MSMFSFTVLLEYRSYENFYTFITMFINIYSVVESSQRKTFKIYSCSRKSVKNDSLFNNHSKYLFENLRFMTAKLAMSGYKT